ncbi:hypothetical protein [Streptomyces sp. 6N223]|uniref:hypothetical protein n=1 Tax=Streptomyces sp. 6N223 TaxID=3457412 RepID=UPI003FD2BAAE
MAFPPPPPSSPPSSPPPAYPGFPGHPPPTAQPASAGLFVALAGLLALALGMGVLDWLSYEVDEETSDTLTLNGVAGVFYAEETREILGDYEHAYLQYLSWLTAFATALTALLATWPQAAGGPRPVLRGTATVLGVFGLISTIVLAASLGDIEEGDLGAPTFDVSAGPWIAVAGFGLLALGALLGPPRPRWPR